MVALEPPTSWTEQDRERYLQQVMRSGWTRMRPHSLLFLLLGVRITEYGATREDLKRGVRNADNPEGDLDGSCWEDPEGLPTTGEIVPLLQIAPPKTDEERLLLVSPEQADVLSTIVCRARDESGKIPLVASYDHGERVWNPPMPLLFQWRTGGQNRVVSMSTIRKALGRDPGRGRSDGQHRAAPALSAPRLPQNLRHRRDHERPAPAHRPDHRRAQEHLHHDGLQGGLSHRGHRSPPCVHRPLPGPAAQRGIPGPDLGRVGLLPRPLRAPQALGGYLRQGVRHRLHPRTRPVD